MARRCDELSKQQEDLVQKAALTLQERMQDDDFLRGSTVGVTIQAKSKELHGLHRQLRESETQNRGAFAKNGEVKTIEDIFQVAQIRIILHDTGNLAGLSSEARQVQASRVLSRARHRHAMWPPVPGNMKDYIATPKLNGYKALHTVVLPIRSEDEKSAREDSTVFPMEIMIRTEAMHILAENGIARTPKFVNSGERAHVGRVARSERRDELNYATPRRSSSWT